MIRRTFFILMSIAVAARMCHAADSTPAKPRKPNIILILADDLGYECIGADGSRMYKTPNIDKMATGGMRFDQCYVQPLCTPTRLQLMTGQYNVRNYIEFGLMDRDSTTFAHPLKEAGYVTGIAGKWQLGQGKKLPQKLGFDEACLWQHTRRPPRYANPGLEFNGEPRDFTNGEYGPKLVNDFALDFITRHKDEPFFLYYPMMLVHGPFPPTPDSPDWNPKATKDNQGNNPKHFADMVAYMDKLVGAVFARLDELHIRDNTLVIFLGDNGTGKEIMSQLNGQAYPGGKGLTNARGMHVPLVANWPGHVPAGKMNADLIDSTDFLPTLCGIAGSSVPTAGPIDGHTFAPQLLGEKGTPREWIYSWYSQSGGPKAKAEFAMTAALKLYRDGRVFNLAADPYEEHALRKDNLNSDQSKSIDLLQGALDKYANARPKTALTSQERPRKPKDPAQKKDPAKKAERKKRRAARAQSSGTE